MWQFFGTHFSVQLTKNLTKQTETAVIGWLWRCTTLSHTTSMSMRRSARNVGKVVNYKEHGSYFPEEPPSNDFECLLHHLNQQAFPSLSYARVDDLIVFALFATKRCSGHYRALVPATSGRGVEITMGDAISIANIVRLGISRDAPTRDECQMTAMELQRVHHNIFIESDLIILEQCVVLAF
jgi:hypothetical protein